MPLTALLNGERVFASDVAGTSTYTCRECVGAMHYVKASRRSNGSSVVAHFAHNPMPAGQVRACSSEGESDEHRNGKATVRLEAPDYFWWLQGAYSDHETPVEEDDIKRRADVLFVLSDKQRVIFEIQYTKISRREIAERTRDYHKMRCHVIWCWPERRDDLFRFCRKHFYCVGKLSEDGDEVEFFGNISPFRYGPSLSRPFDPEVLPPSFVPPAPAPIAFPVGDIRPTDGERDQFWHELKQPVTENVSDSGAHATYWSQVYEARRARVMESVPRTANHTLIRPRGTGPWASVPPEMRSIVHAYINSEQEKDKERALELCAKYDLDYATMRKVILDAMIARSREQAIKDDEQRQRRIA